MIDCFTVHRTHGRQDVSVQRINEELKERGISAADVINIAPIGSYFFKVFYRTKKKSE